MSAIVIRARPVIGADQTLALGTRVFQKPASIEEARP